MPSLVTRTARIEHQARLLALPLGAWAVRAGGRQGQARYLQWGDPDLTVQRGPWRHLEQMGAAHRLEGPEGALLVTTRKRSRWLTELNVTVSEPTPGQPPDQIQPR